MKSVRLMIGFLLVADIAAAADFAGNWNLSASIGGNPATIQCVLAQQGDALTGTCKPAQFEPSAISGTVTGASAKWGYDVVFNGSQNHVEYDATLGADGKLTGTLHLGPMPVPFTATKE
jgi:hypothetical protein